MHHSYSHGLAEHLAAMPAAIPTGALQTVPVVAPANEHLSSALKRASKVTHAAHIKNEAERERNRGARQMDTLMKVSRAAWHHAGAWLWVRGMVVSTR